MSSYIDYLDSISPRWLNKPNGKKFKKAFGQESDLLTQDLITAVNLGRLDLCDESALELHRRNSNLLQSPLESPEQLRTYLKKRWETWSLSGSKLAITNDLKRIGYTNTKVIDWYDLIKLGVSGPTAPFGGTYKKIAGASVNGDIYYLARLQKNDYSLIQVKHIAAPFQTFSLQLNADILEIRLACDGVGNVISKAKDVVNAINNNSVISKLLFSHYSGTGNDVVGLGPGSGISFEVPFPFWSFFYVTLDAPNGFSLPKYWNASTESTYVYKEAPRFHWSNTGRTLNGIFTRMATKTFGWVVEALANREVYEWDGASTTTLRLTVPVGDFVECLRVNGINSAWLGTRFGRVYHWDGTMWTLVFTHPMIEPIYDFYITSDPLEVGSIFHSKNDLYKFDGTNWILDTTPFPVTAGTVRFHISGSADNNVWIVDGRPLGAGGLRIAKYDGASWTLLTSGIDFPSGCAIAVGVPVNQFQMTDYDDGWILIDNATGEEFLRYDGKKWNFYKFIYYNNAVDPFNGINFINMIAVSKEDIWFTARRSTASRASYVFRYNNKIFERLQDYPMISDLDKPNGADPTIPPSTILTAPNIWGLEAVFPDGEAFIGLSTAMPFSYAIKRNNLAPFPDRTTPYKGVSTMDGCIWNDDCYWDIILPYPSAISDIARVIKKWKPATTSCRFVQVRIGDKWFTFPIHEDWELDGSGSSTQDFYNKTYLYVR